MTYFEVILEFVRFRISTFEMELTEVRSIEGLREEDQRLMKASCVVGSLWQCVLQLVYNALDGDATSIAVRLSPKAKRVDVIDNGCGIRMELSGNNLKMRKFDSAAPKVFSGQKNEFLKSVVVMAESVSILSRTAARDTNSVTMAASFHHGKLNSFGSVSARKCCGTTVTVKRLFNTIPVRQKGCFNPEELEHCIQRLRALCLPFPGTSISLRNEDTGKICLQTHRCGGFKDVFRQLFDEVYAHHLSKIRAKSKRFAVKGFVGKRGHYDASLQFVWINRKPLLHSVLHKLVCDAFAVSPQFSRSKQQRSKECAFPVFSTQIECAASEICVCYANNRTLLDCKHMAELNELLKDGIGTWLRRKRLLRDSDLEKGALGTVPAAVEKSNVVARSLAGNTAAGFDLDAAMGIVESRQITAPKAMNYCENKTADNFLVAVADASDEEVLQEPCASRRDLRKMQLSPSSHMPGRFDHVLFSPPLPDEHPSNAELLEFERKSRSTDAAIQTEAAAIVESIETQTDDSFVAAPLQTSSADETPFTLADFATTDDGTAEDTTFSFQLQFGVSSQEEEEKQPQTSVDTSSQALDNSSPLELDGLQCKGNWYKMLSHDKRRMVFVNIFDGSTQLSTPAEFKRQDKANAMCFASPFVARPPSLRRQFHSFFGGRRSVLRNGLFSSNSESFAIETHEEEPAKPNLVKQLLESWDNPQFKQMQASVLDKVLPGSKSITISTEIFASAVVIGQVDLKFIACKSHNYETGSTLLFLVDQHAADERIRLEYIYLETKSISRLAVTAGSIIASRCPRNGPIRLLLPSESVRILFTSKEKLLDFGLAISEDASGLILVESVPVCLLEKEQNDLRVKNCSRLIDDLTCLLLEFTQMLRDTPAALVVVPKCLKEAMNSQACRSAIKFGDRLTLEQCARLIEHLSKCKLPFQCAHGRPTVVPLIELNRSL